MVNKSFTWRPGREAHHPLKSAGPHLGKTPEQPLCWHSWQVVRDGRRKYSTLLVMTASATPSRTSPKLGSSPPSILLKSFWLSEKMSQNTDTGWGRMIWSKYWIHMSSQQEDCPNVLKRASTKSKSDVVWTQRMNLISGLHCFSSIEALSISLFKVNCFIVKRWFFTWPSLLCSMVVSSESQSTITPTASCTRAPLGKRFEMVRTNVNKLFT